MFKIKILKPTPHFQCQDSETHFSCSTARFRNPCLLFKVKFYQIFGALPFPKRSPSQKYKILFDALKIGSPRLMFKVKFPKPTSCSKASQDSGTHVSCSKPRCSESRFRNPGSHVQSQDVQSQDSKSQLQVSCSQSSFRNPRLTCNPAVRKLIGEGPSNWATCELISSGFLIPRC